MSDKIFTNNLNTITQLVDRKAAAKFLRVKAQTIAVWKKKRVLALARATASTALYFLGCLAYKFMYIH